MLFGREQKIIIKSPEEIEGMRRAGRLASECLAWIIDQVAPGMSTQDIDDLQMDFAKRHDARPAPLNYRGFPKSICTSINEVICHGIPSTKDVLQDGDIVGIDVTLVVNGFHGDNASTIGVGTLSEEARRLLEVTLESHRRGIDIVSPETRLGDIGYAIQHYAEGEGYSVVRDFVGHGIGRTFHEDPQIPHYGERGRGKKLRAGMTFTVEPMINVGDYDAVVLDDGWTAVTVDRKLSAQFEHTIVVTEDGYECLTVTNDTGKWEPPGGF
ncbi:MAG: type I methionyl aminopeptidase [Myxococcota bacterium]